MWQRRNVNGNGRRQRDLASLIDVYLLRCEVEGKSPHTLKAYGETLGRFARIAREEGFPGDISQITLAHLYAYLGRYTSYSMETRHRYFREVRCFFNWLVEADYLKESPFRSLRNVRLPQKIVQPFSPDEVTRLLACCDPDTAIGARDRAILLTLLDTGVRCSELVQLDLDDLDLDAGRLRILYGKGNKQRVVPFASRCREAVLGYLDMRGLEPGPLFLATTGHRRLLPGVALRPNGLKQMLRRRGRDAGISRVHAHRFRHTFATWAIEQDALELDHRGGGQHLRLRYRLGKQSVDLLEGDARVLNGQVAGPGQHSDGGLSLRVSGWLQLPDADDGSAASK